MRRGWRICQATEVASRERALAMALERAELYYQYVTMMEYNDEVAQTLLHSSSQNTLLHRQSQYTPYGHFRQLLHIGRENSSYTAN